MVSSAPFIRVSNILDAFGNFLWIEMEFDKTLGKHDKCKKFVGQELTIYLVKWM